MEMSRNTKKHFANVCHHKSDYGLVAECHFFATSDGKSPCDGLGGTTKRLVAQASLQATVENQILTAYQMFEWANKNIEGIKYFYVSKNDVKTSAMSTNWMHSSRRRKPFAVLCLITVLSPCLKESYRCDDFLQIQTFFAVVFPLGIMQ